MTSPFEQGRRRGELEKSAIRHVLDEVYRFIDFFEIERDQFLKVDKEKLKFVPERFLEECRGLAEGAESSYEEIVAVNFSTVIGRLFRDGCTAFIVPKGCSEDGSVMLLKNRDLGLRRLHPQVLSYSQLDGYNEFLGVTDAGSAYWYQGVNKKGLVVFNTATPCQPLDPTDAQGMATPILVRRMLEECDNVDEAIKFIETNTYSACSNLFLGDCERTAIVEIKAGFKPHVWEIENLDCRSNHYLFHTNPEEKTKEEILSRLQTQTRYARGKQLIAEKGEEKIGVNDLQQFSKDHSNGPSPYSVCRHPPVVGTPLEKLMSSTTLSAEIFKLGDEIETFVALGYPCQTEFVKLKYDEAVPEPLASGTLWLEKLKTKH